MDFRRAAFSLFSDLLEQTSGETVLERREVQDTLIIFKDCVLQAQEFEPPDEQEAKGSRRPTWMNKDLPGKHKKEVYKR